MPTLSYIAQLSPLPARVWRLDVDGARRMYGFALNSLEWKQYFGLASHGFSSVTSVSLYCWAALVRAARKTITVWRHSFEPIKW